MKLAEINLILGLKIDFSRLTEISGDRVPVYILGVLFVLRYTLYVMGGLQPLL